MNKFPSTKAKRVLTALLKIGWVIKRQKGSQIVLFKIGMPDYVFAFHDGE